MSRIKACFYAIFFLLSVSIVIVLMYFFNKSNRKIRQIWGKWQRYCIGYKITQIGEFLDANMLIINHQSILDIVVLEEIHNRNLCWMAKKEIGELPFIGKILSLPKMISVDRNNPRDLVRIMHEVEDRILKDRVIAIFPEGTRGRSKKLLKFQNGAKIIANKLDLKVQPIVLIDTNEILDSKKFRVKSGEVKVFCLDLVDRSDEAWLEKTREKMQEIIDRENLKKESA